MPLTVLYCKFSSQPLSTDFWLANQLTYVKFPEIIKPTATHASKNIHLWASHIFSAVHYGCVRFSGGWQDSFGHRNTPADHARPMLQLQFIEII